MTVLGASALHLRYVFSYQTPETFWVLTDLEVSHLMISTPRDKLRKRK